MPNALFLFLGEIVDAVGFIKPVIGFHQPLHDVDQIPEDLHPSHTVKIGRAGQLFLYGKGQVPGQALDVLLGVSLIGGYAAQIVAAHFAAPFYDHAQIAFILVIAPDQIGDGGAVGHGAVAVAELAIVKVFEAGMGVVLRDGEGVDESIGCLDDFPEKTVEAILIDALTGDGAAETAQASTGKGKVPQVDHPALIGKGGLEVGDHALKALVVLGAVCDDDHIFFPAFGNRGKGRPVEAGRMMGRFGGGGDKRAVGTGKNQLIEKHPGFLLSFFLEQILHIGRQSPDHFHAKIQTVFFHIPVSGHIVKMLGGSDLGGEFAGKIHPVGCDQLHQPVKLIRGDEGIDRIAEQNQVSLL